MQVVCPVGKTWSLYLYERDRTILHCSAYGAYT